LDLAAVRDAARATKNLITVEDHYPEGGLGEAVLSALASSPTPVHSLAVRRKPKSGKPAELLDFEEISARAIVSKVKEFL
jgi:transketolase